MKARYLPIYLFIAFAIGYLAWVTASDLYPKTPVGAFVYAVAGGFGAAVVAGLAVEFCWRPCSTPELKASIVLCLFAIGIAGVVLSVAWTNYISPHRSPEEAFVFRLRALPDESLDAYDLITVLGNRGPQAKWAEPVLREIIRNPKHQSRNHAAWALERIMGRNLYPLERFYLFNMEWIIPSLAGISLFVLLVFACSRTRV